MIDLFFTVHGTAVPQGSTRAFIPKGWTRPVITAANAKTKPWRQEIAGCAISAMQENSFAKIERGEAVTVAAWFYFPRPKSVSKKIEHKTVGNLRAAQQVSAGLFDQEFGEAKAL